jgi:hypothetical protein
MELVNDDAIPKELFEQRFTNAVHRNEFCSSFDLALRLLVLGFHEILANEATGWNNRFEILTLDELGVPGFDMGLEGFESFGLEDA